MFYRKSGHRDMADIHVYTARKLSDMAGSLEELAIELACQRISDTDMEDMDAAQAAFRDAIAKGDAMEIAETDEAYHDVIYNCTRNTRLVQILNNLREQMYRFRLEYIKGAAQPPCGRGEGGGARTY